MKPFIQTMILIVCFIECLATTFLHFYWLNWVDEEDDASGLKERPEDTRYIYEDYIDQIFEMQYLIQTKIINNILWLKQILGLAGLLHM